MYGKLVPTPSQKRSRIPPLKLTHLWIHRQSGSGDEKISVFWMFIVSHCLLSQKKNLLFCLVLLTILLGTRWLTDFCSSIIRNPFLQVGHTGDKLTGDPCFLQVGHTGDKLTGDPCFQRHWRMKPFHCGFPEKFDFFQVGCISRLMYIQTFCLLNTKSRDSSSEGKINRSNSDPDSHPILPLCSDLVGVFIVV